MMWERHQERPPRRCRRPAVLAVTAALLASGCGLPHREGKGGAATSPPAALPSSPPATPPPSTAPPSTAAPHGGLPDPEAVDRHDATAVSRAAVQVMWTVDAAIDRGQGDAYRRARPYLTPRYAARADAQLTGAVPSVWRDHRAYARVGLAAQTLEDGVPADTARTAHRQWDITVTPTGRDGWKGTSTHAIAFVTLTRDAENAWWVSEVTTA